MTDGPCLKTRGPRVVPLFATCSRCGLVALEKTGFCKPCQAGYGKAWVSANRDRARAAHNRWRDKNVERERERGRKWARSSREQRRDLIRANNQKRRALQKDAPGARYSTAPLIQQRVIYHGSRCRYCGATENLTIDHMIPLSRGGGHWPSNLVPCCGSCNSSKRDKTFREFVTYESRRLWATATRMPPAGSLSARPNTTPA